MPPKFDPYVVLPQVPILNNRQTIILEKCQGKRVLHLGCVDAGLLQQRFEEGVLMHQKLHQCTQDLWGFDIDAQGIAFLQKKGFNQLIVGDVSYIDQVGILSEKEFDVIVASEVVEHLQNPGLFLQAVQKIMKPGHTKLIVTVPNAFRIDTLLWLLKGVEYVHPDHNYWFSYLTLTNLFKKNDLQITDMYVYAFTGPNILPNHIRRIFNASPNLKNPDTSPDNLSSKPISNLQRARMYLKSLPKRILIRYLYSRTPFWGDGLIVEAIVD